MAVKRAAVSSCYETNEEGNKLASFYNINFKHIQKNAMSFFKKINQI